MPKGMSSSCVWQNSWPNVCSWRTSWRPPYNDCKELISLNRLHPLEGTWSLEQVFCTELSSKWGSARYWRQFEGGYLGEVSASSLQPPPNKAVIFANMQLQCPVGILPAFPEYWGGAWHCEYLKEIAVKKWVTGERAAEDPASNQMSSTLILNDFSAQTTEVDAISHEVHVYEICLLSRF